MKLNACLTLDAWSNIKNEPIVNYMLISDSSTFFLKSVSTGGQSHDAKWIAQDMERMLDFSCQKGLDFIQATGKQKESQQKIHDIITDERILFAAITTIEIGFLVWRCNWDRIFARSSVRWRKDDSFLKRTKAKDLIFDYGSETEQHNRWVKRKAMYLQYTNFVIKANHNKDQKDFRFLMLEKGNQDYPAVLVG
ncbi:hypothetical protein BASA50_004303 [Batrachochytrium salamandrivorans]|uniref:DUF659 domain-containing protein n=1 Tax=Batrachochytrium salamandrivorans TaxID=1357716 RepID=A0ABQ8FIX5_9FUNG|nr:hypothetical protein BASA50_004303 [Batrachochytrium salamandrivorans]